MPNFDTVSGTLECENLDLYGLRLDKQTPITPRTQDFLKHFHLSATQSGGYLQVQGIQHLPLGRVFTQAVNSFKTNKEQYLAQLKPR